MVARSQSEHESINRRQYPGTRELCCLCGEPTGRAGRGEDSIYRIVAPNSSTPGNPSYADILIAPYFLGGECGPLCVACNSAYDAKFLPE